MTEHMQNAQSPTDEAPRKTQTRRQLLKVLAGMGVAMGMLALPNKWTKPVVEVGLLPVHAQGSEPVVPPYSLLRCAVTTVQIIDVIDAESSVSNGVFYPDSILRMVAAITPGDAGVQLRRTVRLNLLGHPQHGIDYDWTGPTVAGGLCQSADFPLLNLTPISAGPDRVTVTWSFVDPADGLGTCGTNLEIEYYT